MTVKTDYEYFLENKLTQDDLDRFSDILNDLNRKHNEGFEEQQKAKKLYADKIISKNEYKAIIKNVKQLKVLYKEAAATKVFRDNYLLIKNIYRRTKVFDQRYQEIEQDFLDAKTLYKKSKEVIKIKGKMRLLTKLNDIAIKIEGLSFRYNENLPEVLKNVNLEIKEGEYVTIVGHNGSGKSTLSKLIIGVLHNKVGQIEVFGNTLNEGTIDRIRQFLGIVFQNPDNQFIGSTVQDDIAFGLENKQVNPKKMQEIIVEAAKKVQMVDYLEKEPLMLSGGQKQRVAIASTLALNPDILIFDEATSMLDPKGKNEIKKIMVELKNMKTKTIISITHDMDEIMNASKVVVMNNGEVMRVGTPAEIMKDKEFLRSVRLEIPFLGAVQESLEKEGIVVNNTNSLDELVDELWQQM